MNIHKKLIGYSILIAIIPVIITAFLSFRGAENAIKNKSYDHLTTAVILKESEIKIWMNENIGSMYMLQNVVQNILNATEEENHSEKINRSLELSLQELQFQHPEFIELFLIDTKNGAVRLSTDTAQISKIKLSNPFFVEGKKSLFVQAFYYSSALHELATTLSTPINDKNGNLIYVLAARLKMDLLEEIMKEAGGLGESGETYLVNVFNFPITHLKYANQNDALGIYSEGVKNCLAGINGSGIYKDYRGTEVIGAYRWMKDFDICIVAEINETEAFQDIKSLQRRIIGISVLILVTAIMAGLLISLAIFRPIKRLTETAKIISEGNLWKKIDESVKNEKNEIGILAHTLSKMQNELNRLLSETKSILQTMPSALFVIEKNGIIKRVNKKAESLLGYSESELIGKHFKDLLGVEHFSPKDFITERKQKSADKDLYILSKTGQRLSVNASFASLSSNKYYKGGIIIIIKDVSELKEYAKSRIREIAPILNQISLGDFKASLALPEKNDEFTDLIVALNLMTDNLKEMISENYKKTQAIKESEKKLSTSHKTLLKAKDNIEQEKAKAEALLGNIGEGIMATDSKGKVIMMNQAAEKMFNLKISDAIGKLFLDCCDFLDEVGGRLDINKKPMKDVLEKNKTVYLKTIYKKPSGLSTPLATTIAPIIHDGKATGLVATFRDITKEKEVDDAKSEFVSLASHQLRTPLTAIKWILEELMRNPSLSKHQLEYLRDAMKSNSRMISLVNDLLNVSRLETGSISVDSIETDVTTTINQLIKEAKPLFNKKKQKLEFLKPSQKIKIEIDPQLLSQVVGNLISNAIKYSDDNSTIKIKLKKEKTGISIMVVDQGIGVPKEQQHRLFQKFFRTGEAVRRSTSGSGLGLYIVKKVIDAMHGKISFESVENEGTSFSMSFPLKGPTIKGDVKKLIEHKVS